MKKKYLIILNLIIVIGILQVQSQNQNGFNTLKEHQAFKQKLMNEARFNFENPVNSQSTFMHHNSVKGISDYGNAPDWGWSAQFGGSGNDYACDIVSDAAGNVYIAGSFSGNISIASNNYTSSGNRDAIVAKFDNTGNLLWLKQLSATADESVDAFGICLAEDENIYVTGYYTGSVSFGGINLPNDAFYNLFFIKLNSLTGDMLMAKNNGGPGESNIGLKIDTDNTGNIYILGSSSTSTSWRHPTIFLKYDASGNIIWEKEQDESFNDMKVYNSNIYFSAYVDGNNDGDIGNGIILEPKGYGAAFIAKSDLSGNFIWASMGDHININYSDSYGIDICIDENENIYMIGHFKDDAIFGGDTLLNWHSTGFIVKCSSEGNFLWANQVDEITDDVSVDVSNNSFVLYDKYIRKYNSNGLEQWTKELNNYPASFTLNTADKILTAGNTTAGLIFTSQLDNSANKEWIAQFGGDTGYGYIIAMVTDNFGNFYTYGYASAEMDYFGETIENGLFLSKQNSQGDLIWLKKFPNVYMYYGDGNYLSIDTLNGYVYFTGDFDVPLIIPGGPTLTPNENGSVFIIKYDLNGIYQSYVKEDFKGMDMCLSPDFSGDILLSGTFDVDIIIGTTNLTSAGYYDVFIAKYDDSGNFLWAKRAGGESMEWIGLISIDENDNIYFTGEFTSENVTFDNTSITLEDGDGNIVFAKLGPNGNVIWLTSKAGSLINYGDYYCWPTGIKTDANGYSYIKGWHGDSTYFDNIMLRSPYGMGYSYFIAKFDSDGNTIWANSITEHHYGFDYNQMDIDNQGSVYLGAQINDTIDFGDDFQYINVGDEDLFVAKYDSSGILDWVKIMESSTVSYNWLSSVAVYDTTNIFVAGHFNNYITFGSDELFSTNKHGFISMIKNNNVGFKEVYNKNDNLIIYPNPSDGLFFMNYKTNENTDVEIKIINITGQTIFHKTNKTNTNVQIDLGKQPKGIYLIKAGNNNCFTTKKIIVK